MRGFKEVPGPFCHVRTQQVGAGHKLGRDLHQNMIVLPHWSWISQPPELWAITSVVYKPPNLCYSSMNGLRQKWSSLLLTQVLTKAKPLGSHTPQITHFILRMSFISELSSCSTRSIFTLKMLLFMGALFHKFSTILSLNKLVYSIYFNKIGLRL